jgi:ABC-type sugar transport system ATPase subunit
MSVEYTTSTLGARSFLLAPQIKLDQVGKKYGVTTVLNNVSLTIEPGEIHGLVGENGAGKSTLLKILGGAITADRGSVSFDGIVTKIDSPRASISHGVALIAQELALIPKRSVVENIFLGRWSNQLGVATPAADLDAFEELRRETGFELDPNSLVEKLSIGQAQQVEIMKALARGAKVLCMDEPTAVLGEAETENLMRLLRVLAKAGTTIILVSHFLDEVLSIANRITVLRDGEQVVTSAAEDHSHDSLVKLMIGREVEILSRVPLPLDSQAPVVMSVVGVTDRKIRDISFEVRRGEILGLVGLVGSGRSELLHAIFGSTPVKAGKVIVNGKSFTTWSVQKMMHAGMALVPESRKEQGLVLGRNALENIALPTLRRRMKFGLINRRLERREAVRVSKEVDVRGDIFGVPAGSLSGGNQQKALFAKWLLDPPIIFLVDEPTRGVDIAAKANIHSLILDLASAGTAVIVASSDLEEVVGLSHRLIVMNRGRIVREFDRSASRNEIMSAAFL